jgi:hypothetical protein
LEHLLFGTARELRTLEPTVYAQLSELVVDEDMPDTMLRSLTSKVFLGAAAAVVLIAVVVALVLSAPQRPGTSSVGAASPTPPAASSAEPPSVMPTTAEVPSKSAVDGGLSRDDAIGRARSYLADSQHPMYWTSQSGAFKDVYEDLAHAGPIGVDEPLPDVAKPDAQVWAVVFKVTISICEDCELRDALDAVFIDYESGELITASIWGPANGDLGSPPPQ